jgi:hypothetical protein
MLYLRLEYQASYFPPYFEGEEGLMLDLAKATSDYAAYSHSWWPAFTGGLIDYNKGYAWALVPFYLRYGYDVRIVTYILPVFISIFCAAFFTIYRATHPKSSLWSFVLIVVFAVLCVSARRYKWHTMNYLTAVSVYLYFLPQFRGGSAVPGQWKGRVFSLLLFAFSCFFYFGGFIYAVPFFFLAVFFSGKEKRRKELLWASAGLIVFLAAANVASRVNDLWGVRIWESLGHIEDGLSWEGLKSRWWTVTDLFTSSVSPPYLILFLVGLAASFDGIRRGDRFALVNTTLLLFIWSFQFAIEGINNPDQLNWSMIPFLGVLLIGADQILALIRDRVRGGALLCAALALVVAWKEVRFYPGANERAFYQPYVQPRNTMTQAALVLMLMRDDHSETAQYYLPDPSIAGADGGLNYGVSMNRVDFAKALSEAVFFTSEEDLRKKIAAQKTNRWAIVYLGVDLKPDKKGAKDPVAGTLLGQAPEIVHPYEDVYGIGFLVRKYRIKPVNAIVPPAAGRT